MSTLNVQNITGVGSLSLDTLTANNATVSGLSLDTLTANNATVSGTLTANNSTIGGLSLDTLTANNATIGGLSLDTLTANNATIGGANVVTVSDTQTLTNKTLTTPSISTPTFTGTPIEDVYSISGTSVSLEPDNGSVQTHTLSGATTYTDGFSSGQAMTLMIDDGADYIVTWPTMTWVNSGGTAPALETSGYTVLVLWKVSTTLYGALVGGGS